MGFFSLDVFIYEMKHQTHTALMMCCCFSSWKWTMPLTSKCQPVWLKVSLCGGAVPTWVIFNQALKVIMRKLQIAILVMCKCASAAQILGYFFVQKISLFYLKCVKGPFSGVPWFGLYWTSLPLTTVMWWLDGCSQTIICPNILCWATWCVQIPHQSMKININNLLEK